MSRPLRLALAGLMPCLALAQQPPAAAPEIQKEPTASSATATPADQENPKGALAAPAADPAKLAAITESLRSAYGDLFQGAALNAAGRTVFRIAGREFIYDDGRTKTFDEQLAAPDLEDTFRPLYPLTNPTDTVPENFDPGRFRVEALFKALYGATEAEVAKNCVPVVFCGHKVRFNARCGAAAALAQVGKDLDEAAKAKPALKDYLTDLGGTFQWRFIAGTQQLSNHSFGTAIDLNVKKSAYWRWEKPAKLKTFSRMDWPVEIIEAFERHGFIWGGKWWHFDTMHFEYRPELIHFARSQAGAAPAEKAAPTPSPAPEAGKEGDRKEPEKKSPPSHEFLEPFRE